MTTKNDLKDIIRERMKRTGESYMAAQRNVRASTPKYPLVDEIDLRVGVTPDQVRGLLAKQDDHAASHIVWVSRDGFARISRLGVGEAPVDWAEEKSDLLFRLETLGRGNDYVGPHAAEDNAWVGRLVEALAGNWKSKTEGYVDWF